MRSVIFLFLSFFAFIGCSHSSNRNFYKNNGRPKVLSTIAMIDDLVGEIGGDRIDHIPLIVGEIDPHSYELVKGDDEKISSANVVISNGLNLEHGASLRYLLEKHSHVVFLGNEIQKRVPEKILIVDGEVDPHVWMDISLWAEGIDSIVEALSAQMPSSQAYFEKRAEFLRRKMEKTHHSIRKMLAKVPEERRYLVTSHDAFNYFTRAYLAKGEDWKERCVAPEGLAPEGQLSTLDIRRVIDHLSKFHIRVVFPESNVSRDALGKVVSSCVHPVRLCSKTLYGDAMGPLGTEAGCYLGMIEHNARVLKEEWNR